VAMTRRERSAAKRKRTSFSRLLMGRRNHAIAEFLYGRFELNDCSNTAPGRKKFGARNRGRFVKMYGFNVRSRMPDHFLQN
jgi:hypothetical protein